MLAVTALPGGKGDNDVPQSKLDIERYVNDLATTVLAENHPMAHQEVGPLEPVLKGMAIELWSNAAGSLSIVADEDDAIRLRQPRGTVYTASEMRRVIQIGDPALVREIHEWKRLFSGRIRE